MDHPWLELRSGATKECSSEDMRECLMNMRRFHSLKKMQEAVLMLIVSFLTSSADKERLMLCFKAFDLDGDGVINREELTYGYAKYLGGTGPDIDQHVSQIIAAIDKNHSGVIDYSGTVRSTQSL